MRKIVYSHLISANGYVETKQSYRGPNWALSDEELSEHFSEIEELSDCHFYGRIVYQAVSAFWPTADSLPDTPKRMAEYSAIWREKKKYVFSTTLTQADWNTQIISDQVKAHVQELKSSNGKAIFLYGSQLASALLRESLVDELRLYVNPILIGDGVRMLEPHADVTRLKLLDVKQFTCGVTLLHYSISGT